MRVDKASQQGSGTEGEADKEKDTGGDWERRGQIHSRAKSSLLEESVNTKVLDEAFSKAKMLFYLFLWIRRLH